MSHPVEEMLQAMPSMLLFRLAPLYRLQNSIPFEIIHSFNLDCTFGVSACQSEELVAGRTSCLASTERQTCQVLVALLAPRKHTWTMNTKNNETRITVRFRPLHVVGSDLQDSAEDLN